MPPPSSRPVLPWRSRPKPPSGSRLPSPESIARPASTAPSAPSGSISPTTISTVFEVRNARLSVDGRLTPLISYKAEIDLAAIAVTDYRRHRATCGLTLSLLKPFTSDIRINYERYFYRTGAVPKIGEQDKFVIELMTRF